MEVEIVLQRLNRRYITAPDTTWLFLYTVHAYYNHYAVNSGGRTAVDRLSMVTCSMERCSMLCLLPTLDPQSRFGATIVEEK